MSTRLGRLVASGKPVEVTRYMGTVGQGVMVQLTAETGYVQVQLAELLRMLVKPIDQVLLEEKNVDESIAAGNGICLPCREGHCVHVVCKPRGCRCDKPET
jgi:hypothetical protein